MAKALAKAIKAALAGAHQAVAEVRGRLDQLKAERARIADAPIPFEEAVAALEERLDDMAGKYRGDWAIADLARIDRYPRGQVKITPGLGLDVAGDHQEVAMVFFCRDIILEKLTEQLRRRYQDLAKLGAEPIPTAEREATLIRIDADIQTAESEEEALIIDAEEAGTSIPRREDLSPEIFLEVEN